MSRSKAAIHADQMRVERETAERRQRMQKHTGVYDFGLPPLSSASKGAQVIEHTQAAVSLRFRGKYIGLFDPRK